MKSVAKFKICIDKGLLNMGIGIENADVLLTTKSKEWERVFIETGQWLNKVFVICWMWIIDDTDCAPVDNYINMRRIAGDD